MTENDHKPVQPNLPVSQFRLFFSSEQPIKLPAYPGSAWRGAFGHALKRTVCIVRNTPCSDCMLKTSCAYSYIFETPPSANTVKMRKYNAAPHPFVLQMHEHCDSKNDGFILELILFGHANRFFPYIVHAFDKAGYDGVGGKRQAFILQKVAQIGETAVDKIIYQDGKLSELQPPMTPEIPPVPREVEFCIHTPIRIKQDGRNLAPASFNFGALFGNLLRRISMLTYFHTDTPFETDFKGLMEQAKKISINTEMLQWRDWKRYSSRQQTEMNMGGVIGKFSMDMTGLEIFWPFLWLGQWTHAGKGTSMGLGAYTIIPASLPTK